MNTFLHKIIHKFYQLLRQIKVKYRLLLTFFFVTLIPLLVITTITYKTSVDTNLETLQNYSSATMSQASNALSNTLTALEDIAVRISYTTDLQSLLQADLLNTPATKRQTLIDRIQTDMEYEFMLDNAVEQVILYTVENASYYNLYGSAVDENSYLITTLEDTITQIHQEGGRTVFSSFLSPFPRSTSDSVNGYVQLARPVYDKYKRTLQGYIFLTFQENHLASVYRQVNSISDSKTFIIGSNNVILSNIGTKLTIGESFRSPDLLPRLENNGFSKQPTFDLHFHEKDYFTAYSPIMNTHLFVVSLIPKSYIYESNIEILQNSVILAFFSFLLAFIASLIVSQSIISPIQQLMHKIQNLRSNGEQFLYRDSASDELAVLNNTFNDMIENLSKISHQNKIALMEKHKMHLNVLQAQINPHFLVNTLNSVKYLATYQNASNIEELSTALINVIRQTFGKNNELTTVSDELRGLQDYAIIQSYRYISNIHLDTYVEDAVKDCLLPRFLIQPLVENCYLHGFKELQNKGLISVRVHHCDDNCLHITVTDNGIGISQERISELLNLEIEHKIDGVTSFGIHNINERIQLYYGKKYALSIHSEPYIYTTFEMTLPQEIPNTERKI